MVFHQASSASCVDFKLGLIKLLNHFDQNLPGASDNRDVGVNRLGNRGRIDIDMDELAHRGRTCWLPR